jgi:hypothetical protein
VNNKIKMPERIYPWENVLSHDRSLEIIYFRGKECARRQNRSIRQYGEKAIQEIEKMKDRPG